MTEGNVLKLDPKSILIYDTTLRDGEQTPGVAFTPEQKMELTKLLDRMGVPLVSMGYPAVSEDERAGVRAIMKARDRGEIGCRLSVLSRPLRSDIDCALDCGCDLLSFFLPTSDIHLRTKFGSDGRAKIMRMLEEGAEYAARKGAAWGFAAEDTTRTEFEFLVRVFRRSQDLGALWAFVCDTVGLMTPERMTKLVSDLRREVPDIRVMMHCHNDYGLATANSLAGVLGGACGISVTINGIGERAGNCPLDEAVLALKHLYGRDLGLKTELFTEAARLVERYSGITRDPFKPISGAHAFAHESGIHVSALLKDPLTYQPFPPEEVGRRCEFIIGKHSSRGVVKMILASQGAEISDERAEKLIARIQRDAVERGIHFAAEDLNRYYDRVKSELPGGQGA